MQSELDYLQQVLQEAKQRKEDAALLAELFSLKFPDFPIPHERQFNIWLRSFSSQIIADSFEATAKWVEEEISKADTDEWPVYIDGPDGQEELTLNRVQRYATGVMKVKRTAAETKRGAQTIKGRVFADKETTTSFDITADDSERDISFLDEEDDDLV